MKNTLPFKMDIISQMCDLVLSNAPYRLDLSVYKKKPIPKTFHGVTNPGKQELLSTKMSRMNK